MITLLAYPRSGSTLFRYLLEQITGRPTSNDGDITNTATRAIGVGRKLHGKSVVDKVHYSSEVNIRHGALILLSRELLEVIPSFLYSERRCTSDRKEFVNSLTVEDIVEPVCQYRNNKAFYDNWKGLKCSFKYEDMMTDPVIFIRRLVDCFGGRVVKNVTQLYKNCRNYKSRPELMPCNTEGNISMWRSLMNIETRERLTGIPGGGPA